MASIFKGMDARMMADALGVPVEVAEKMKREDERGFIVKVSKRSMSVIRPTEMEERRGVNGLEELYCSMKIRHYLDDPMEADVYSKQGGRLNSVNMLKLPILRYIGMSAEKGNLKSVSFNEFYLIYFLNPPENFDLLMVERDVRTSLVDQRAHRRVRYARGGKNPDSVRRGEDRIRREREDGRRLRHPSVLRLHSQDKRKWHRVGGDEDFFSADEESDRRPRFRLQGDANWSTRQRLQDHGEPSHGAQVQQRRSDDDVLSTQDEPPYLLRGRSSPFSFLEV